MVKPILYSSVEDKNILEREIIKALPPKEALIHTLDLMDLMIQLRKLSSSPIAEKEKHRLDSSFAQKMITNEVRQLLHQVCKALGKYGVDCMLVGGTAVAFYGYQRISGTFLWREK